MTNQPDLCDPIARLGTQAAAELLGVSIRTLEDWRSKQIGPKFIRIGKKLVRYEVRELVEFLTKGVSPKELPLVPVRAAKGSAGGTHAHTLIKVGEKP